MGIGRLVESGAVSAGCNYTPVSGVDESPVCSVRELNGEANCLVEDSDVNIVKTETVCLPPTSTNDCTIPEECKSSTTSVRGERSILKNWWKQLVNRKSTTTKLEEERVHTSRIKVCRKKKSTTDLSALYLGQEISAHKGLIWTMKFSPDGKYLASGGEDGLIKIWRVTQASRFMKEIEQHQTNNVSRKKTNNRGRVVVPDKLFQVEKSPIHEFRGHTGGILDVAWSSSNCLLSASKDKSVRLWEMGSDECLAIYRHCNYVTCVQFNPLNDNYFVSGSIDGKIRIWDQFERRVVEWADVRDQVTAICYQPDGKGLVVGTLKGFCFHYELSVNGLQLSCHVIRRKKKSSSKKITCIQFPPDDNSRIMISSEDSEVRIVDLDVSHNVEAGLVPKKPQRQMSDAFTSDGGYVISARNNSQVYMRRYNERSSSSSSCSSDRSISARSLSSCEYFSFHGVSVAVPWRRECQGSVQKRDGVGGRRDDHLGRFSLGNWFSMEASTRVSATWPEEKLPVMGGRERWQDDDQNVGLMLMSPEEQLSETWGLVIVTAGWDGIIRTFHNFGLPAPAPAVNIF